MAGLSSQFRSLHYEGRLFRTPLNSYVTGLYALRSAVVWINTVGRTALDWMSGWLNSQLG